MVGKHHGTNILCLCLFQSTLSKEKVEGEADVGRATADEEMAEVELSGKGLEEFLATGRTGRRNALGDIQDQVAGGLTTADLPLDMAKLSCSGN